MSRYGRALREPLLTDGTAERLLSTVRAEMRGEVSGLGKCLATDLAVVWFLAAMRAHVCLECGGTGIALAAHLTDVAPRLAWSSLGLGGGRVVVVRLDTTGRRSIADHCTSHREGENVERNRLHIVLVFRQTDAGPRHCVTANSLARGIGGSRTLSHCLHEFCAAFGHTRHGISKDCWWCGGLRSTVS